MSKFALTFLCPALPLLCLCVCVCVCVAIARWSTSDYTGPRTNHYATATASATTSAITTTIAPTIIKTRVQITVVVSMIKPFTPLRQPPAVTIATATTILATPSPPTRYCSPLILFSRAMPCAYHRTTTTSQPLPQFPPQPLPQWWWEGWSLQQWLSYARTWIEDKG